MDGWADGTMVSAAMTNTNLNRSAQNKQLLGNDWPMLFPAALMGANFKGRRRRRYECFRIRLLPETAE